MRRIFFVLCILFFTGGKLRKVDNAIEHDGEKFIFSTRPTFWVDGSRGETLDLDASGNVRYWYSRIDSKGVKQTATAGERPSYTNFINGKRVVTFDGVDDNLVSAWAVDDIYDTDLGTSIQILSPANKSGGDQYIVRDGSTQWASAISSYVDHSDGPGFDLQYSESGVGWHFIEIGAFTYDVPSILRYTWNGSNVVAQVDDLSAVTEVAGDLASAATTLAFSSIAAGVPYKGDIAEVLFWDRQLTNYEYTRIYEYLSKKWGIDVKFSAN